MRIVVAILALVVGIVTAQAQPRSNALYATCDELEDAAKEIKILNERNYVTVLAKAFTKGKFFRYKNDTPLSYAAVRRRVASESREDPFSYSVLTAGMIAALLEQKLCKNVVVDYDWYVNYMWPTH